MSASADYPDAGPLNETTVAATIRNLERLATILVEGHAITVRAAIRELRRLEAIDRRGPISGPSGPITVHVHDNAEDTLEEADRIVVKSASGRAERLALKSELERRVEALEVWRAASTLPVRVAALEARPWVDPVSMVERIAELEEELRRRPEVVAAETVEEVRQDLNGRIDRLRDNVEDVLGKHDNRIGGIETTDLGAIIGRLDELEAELAAFGGLRVLRLRVEQLEHPYSTPHPDLSHPDYFGAKGAPFPVRPTPLHPETYLLESRPRRWGRR